MTDQKVKLTKYVTVNMPGLPNFIIHEDGKMRISVPVRQFSERELKKIGMAWTDALIAKAAKKKDSIPNG